MNAIRINNADLTINIHIRYASYIRPSLLNQVTSQRVLHPTLRKLGLQEAMFEL